METDRVGRRCRSAPHGGHGAGGVVNPSGGLISKRHPLGATGLAQCAELTRQLRSAARRAPGMCRAACPPPFRHNIGLRGAAVVSVYRMATAIAASLGATLGVPSTA